MSTTTARPRQTTMAGAMVMLGSVFVVLAAWEQVTRLRSIESQEEIESFLSGDLGGRFGLSVESAIEAMHVVSIVAALCAVAGVALGWQVLQRSSGARLALSVLVVPLVLTGLAAAGFMVALVAAATVALWLSPSREWFAGQPLPEPAKRPRTGMQVWEQTPNQATDRDPHSSTPSTPASTSTGSTSTGSTSTGSTTQASGWSVSDSTVDQRPSALTIAVVVTVVMASGVFLMTLVSLVLLASQPDVLLEEVRRQNPDLESRGVSEAMLVTTSYVSGAIVLLWSALAVALAVLAARRRAWAARALLVCAAVSAAVALVATLASPVVLVPALAAIVTVNCLRRPDVREWLAGH